MINSSTILRVAQLTDTGRIRKANEDSCIAIEAPEEVRSRKGVLFVVADGLGGHYAGEIASAMVTSLLPTHYFESSDDQPESCIAESIRRVNRAIFLAGEEDPNRKGMGSTVVAAAITGSIMVVANVGDSRGYLLHEGKLQRLSVDHTLLQNTFSFSDDPRRRSSILTQALGPRPEVEPSVRESVLSHDDVILLTSDGLTGLVPESQIQTVLQEDDPEVAAQTLIDLANAQGGDDNITVIVARVLQVADVEAAPVTFSRG